MNEWGITGGFDRSLSSVHGSNRHETNNGFDGSNRGKRKLSDPGPQFPGTCLEPAT